MTSPAPQQPEADGEPLTLKKLTAELADDVAEIRYMKSWKNCTPTEQAQMMFATVELAQHVQRLIAAHDQARDAQKLEAVLEGRPEKRIGIKEYWDDEGVPYMTCKECGGYDECDCGGFNEAIDQYDTVVRAVLVQREDDECN